MAGILLLSGKVPALLFDYFKTWGQNMPVYFWGVQRVMLMHTAPLSEARCSKDSDEYFSIYATDAKHTSLYALRLKQHPCCFWLDLAQSPKNI